MCLCLHNWIVQGPGGGELQASTIQALAGHFCIPAVLLASDIVLKLFDGCHVCYIQRDENDDPALLLDVFPLLRIIDTLKKTHASTELERASLPTYFHAEIMWDD